MSVTFLTNEDKVLIDAETARLSDSIASAAGIFNDVEHYKPGFEQGSYSEDGQGGIYKVDNKCRVRNTSLVYTKQRTYDIHIPDGVAVWIYEVDQEFNVINQVSNSMLGDILYTFTGDYAAFVFKWAGNETAEINPSDLSDFYIKYYAEIMYEQNAICVPMERGRLGSGAYTNVDVYGMRRSAFFVKTNGATKLRFNYPENFKHTYVVLYYYDKDMKYMSYAQALKIDPVYDVIEGAEYVKFYVETDEVINELTVLCIGASEKPTLVKNIQISEGSERIVFDTVRSTDTGECMYYEQGYIRTTDEPGTVGQDPARCVTGFLTFEDTEALDIIIKDGYAISIVEYSLNKEYIGRVVSAVTNAYTLNVTPKRKYRFVVNRTDLANITPNDVPFDTIKYNHQYQDFSTAHLILPPNYTPTGKPVPMVLWMDGSGNFTNWDAAMSEGKMPYLKYLADEGYAVLSVFGWGQYYYNKYPYCGNAYPYVIPTNLATIRKGLEFVCDRFNIDADNVHVMSKSQGGQVALYFATYPVWDFKSIGMFAPVLDYLSMPGEAMYADTRKALAEDLHLTGDVAYFCSSGYSALTDEGNAFLTQNMIKLAGMNEAWTGLCGGTLAENFTKAMADCKTFWNEQRWNNAENPDIYNNHDYVKIAKVPVKIWGASDDASTPYGKMVEVISQLQNGGSEAHMRELPRGTGGHSCADVDGNKIVVTTSLGVTYESLPIGWYENVQWIREKSPK